MTIQTSRAPDLNMPTHDSCNVIQSFTSISFEGRDHPETKVAKSYVFVVSPELFFAGFLFDGNSNVILASRVYSASRIRDARVNAIAIAKERDPAKNGTLL